MARTWSMVWVLLPAAALAPAAIAICSPCTGRVSGASVLTLLPSTQVASRLTSGALEFSQLSGYNIEPLHYLGVVGAELQSSSELLGSGFPSSLFKPNNAKHVVQFRAVRIQA